MYRDYDAIYTHVDSSPNFFNQDSQATVQQLLHNPGGNLMISLPYSTHLNVWNKDYYSVCYSPVFYAVVKCSPYEF